MEASTNSRVGKSRRLLRVVNMSLGNAPAPPPTRNNEDWVPRGKNNLFREFLLALCHNVAPLNSCVNTMALYIAGKRLVFKDANGEEVLRAHEKWLELNAEDGEAAYRSRVSKDLSIQGDCAIEAVMSKAMPQAVYHIDAMRLRSGKKDDRGRVKNYYWCSNWERYTKFGKDYPVTAIPAFGSEGMKTAGKGILFAKDYTPGEDYYGMPWYLPALTDAEVWARIPVFNRTQLDTGFRPAFHIHVFTNSDEQDIEELDANIEEIFTGPDGKTYALTTGTKEEGAPVLTPLVRGDHAGELDKMGDRAEMVIYKACGIPPILMGVDVPTGMSGKGLALEQSVTQFMRTQVEPRQKFLTDPALRFVQLCGITEAVSCEVEQLMPFDSATDPAWQRQAQLRSMTVNEHRFSIGMGKLTIDGKPEEEGGKLDPKGDMLLIEVGPSTAGQEGEKESTSDPKEDA
jgi:hypothetical protein